MTITRVLVAEHVVFLHLFERMERVLPGLRTVAEVEALASLVAGLLEGHAEAEASLAYLALDHVLADRGELDNLHHDHQEIDARLKEVGAAGTCGEAKRLLREGMTASREHFRGEERTVFPLLERLLKPETLEALGRSRMERSPTPRAAHREPVPARPRMQVGGLPA